MSKRLRICDLTTLYIDGGEGGVNTYLREKARFLSRQGDGFSHSVIVPTAGNEVRRFEGSKLYGIASRRYFRNPQHRLLLNKRAVTEILRKLSPDVIEVDCASPLARIAARALAPKPPVIVGFYHVHLPQISSFSVAESLGRSAVAVAGDLAWRYARFCMRPCDTIVVSSATLFEQLRADGAVDLQGSRAQRVGTTHPGDKRGAPAIHCVPLGVNVDLFRPGLTQNASGADGKTLLFVGRLSREKDLPVLFKAYEHLAARGSYRLRIVGDGPLRGLVERFAARWPNVEYLGLRPYGPELAKIYCQSDVLAVPSPSETFGLTVLEALASGIPVVAVRKGGPADIVDDTVGALSRPGDAGDFAAKIETVLDRPPAGPEVSNVHRDHVLRHYSWDRTFTELVALYQRQLGRAPGREVKEYPVLHAASTGG